MTLASATITAVFGHLISSISSSAARLRRQVIRTVLLYHLTPIIIMQYYSLLCCPRPHPQARASVATTLCKALIDHVCCRTTLPPLLYHAPSACPVLHTYHMHSTSAFCPSVSYLCCLMLNRAEPIVLHSAHHSLPHVHNGLPHLRKSTASRT